MAHMLFKRLMIAGSTATLAATMAFGQLRHAREKRLQPRVIPLPKSPPKMRWDTRSLSRLQKNGLRGTKFGSPSSAIQGLSLTTQRGALKIYQKSGETLNIGDCQLDKVLYHFVDDKFMGVSLFPKDSDDGKTLLEIFEIAFGTGATAKPHADSGEHKQHADEFFWKGKVANARLSLAAENHQAEAWIGNNDLSGSVR